MYGKIFDSMYDGTLRGHWQAIVTLQQMIVLADADGVVDMTAEAISSRTTIPIGIIQAGIEHLMKEDPYTRTPGEDGRRIVLIDEHRPWGWRLVNHAKYRGLRNMAEKRENDRERMAEKRRKNSDVAIPSQKSPMQYADAEAERRTLSGGAPDGVAERREAKAISIRVVSYLNQRAGTRYRATEAHLRLMVARILQDGATEDEMRAVIDVKVADWGNDPEKRRYLSPDTLFNATKYAKYAGQIAIAAAPAQKLEVKAYAERADGTRELVITYQANGLNAEAAARQVLEKHFNRFEQAHAKNIILDNGRATATFSLKELRA